MDCWTKQATGRHNLKLISTLFVILNTLTDSPRIWRCWWVHNEHKFNQSLWILCDLAILCIPASWVTFCCYSKSSFMSRILVYKRNSFHLAPSVLGIRSLWEMTDLHILLLYMFCMYTLYQFITMCMNWIVFFLFIACYISYLQYITDVISPTESKYLIQQHCNFPAGINCFLSFYLSFSILNCFRLLYLFEVDVIYLQRPLDFHTANYI